MCSVSELLDMDSFQGDLTDVVRGIGGHVLSPETPPQNIWPIPLTHPPPSPSSDLHINPFGDPFVSMNDPLLQELNAVTNSSYFSTIGDSNNTNNNGFLVPKVFEEDHIKSQCSIFPRIRISHSNIIHDSSPCNSPAMSAHAVAAAAAASPRGIINVDTNSPRNCLLVDGNTFSSQIQISSPRNLGLKRRKSQAKKVVCIPAPAAMNSRSSGEVVPSDLWAWRKYGQKPIKGSPFPRGYYRCSSSKGCSARKQVERSRTDPNMLVITYTSEHNHPWPIQRNALAGSTRSSSSSTNPNSSKSPTANANAAATSIGSQNTTYLPSSATPPPPPPPVSVSSVKDERGDDMELENVEDDDDIAPYRPELHDHQNQPDDFFADLEELEGDSLSMLLSQGCAGDGKDKKMASDGISDFFGWSGDNNNNNNNNNDDRDSRSL
ncbi:PREDICTED: probable WRKY transcription factor 14 [Camelina sativa]|uniref:Probable WRKY transcription factor 14 n=1 Tax=Camelina sativa TaxID=90675 RepID=A0ABM0WZQ0_CAMSA|nr:PREDICTED: probable WRKY transcription factor 14 [Camelina sativa]